MTSTFGGDDGRSEAEYRQWCDDRGDEAYEAEMRAEYESDEHEAEWEALMRRIDAGEYDDAIDPVVDDDFDVVPEGWRVNLGQAMTPSVRQHIRFPESPLPAIRAQLAEEAQGDARP
ncbi:hypothetical protein MUO65_01240 [bacterium]|nr:hypothetical protein [bacterium]